MHQKKFWTILYSSLDHNLHFIIFAVLWFLRLTVCYISSCWKYISMEVLILIASIVFMSICCLKYRCLNYQVYFLGNQTILKNYLINIFDVGYSLNTLLINPPIKSCHLPDFIMIIIIKVKLRYSAIFHRSLKN